MNKAIGRMTQDEMNRMHQVQLEILDEIKRICDMEKISYCISAGTLLGAVRHRGFIPWDDDIDVAFLRSEYERFRKVCRTRLDKERFYFQDFRDTSGYRWGYGKIRRKGTCFVREHQERLPYEQGIFVDLMPYDYVPKNYLLRQMKRWVSIGDFR